MTVFSKIVSGSWNHTSSANMQWMIDLSTRCDITTVLGTIVICFISYYLFKWVGGEGNVPIRDYTKNHSWISIKVTSKSWYCSICEALLLNGIGVYCDCCGVCADPECVKKADTKLLCKTVTSSNEEQPHHWVKGNLPLGAVCYICSEECCLEPGLVDHRCCWCQRCIHTDCLSKVDSLCDFGPFRNMIVPPYSVQMVRRKGGLRKQFILKAIRDPGWPNWSPLIIVANKRSGNNDGALLLSEFRKYLNPAQVIDLSERKPPAALQWCVLLSPKQARILVGGGDGTVAWVLTSAYKLDLDPEPAVGIVPLGTGNDLSRVLGWGRAHDPDVDGESILGNLQSARSVELDRWKVEVISSRHLGLRIPSKLLYMYNYCSIGVDAQVALNFHKTRDGPFYIFGSRIFNKILYLCYGTHQVMSSDCKNLEQKLDLYLDNEKVDLPELESIIVLNISSWGAGVNLWSMCGNNNPQSYHDGYLEVVGIYSSFHIAQLQVGLSTPYRLGQCKTVEIRLKSKSPIQIDGEPWEQNPATIKISYINKCNVLVNQNIST